MESTVDTTRKVRRLRVEHFKPYNKSIDLYKVTDMARYNILEKQLNIITVAIERDYVRPNDSGRKHQSDQSMNTHAENCMISFLIVGNCAAQVETVKQLEKAKI